MVAINLCCHPCHETICRKFVENISLLSRNYLDQINKLTERQQTIISETKKKAMIMNFTEKYNFHTRLQLKGQNIEIVEKIKILGTVVSNQLSWDDNCSILVKKKSMLGCSSWERSGALAPLKKRWSIHGKLFVEEYWSRHVFSGIVA